MSLAMDLPSAPPLPSRHPGRRPGHQSTDTVNTKSSNPIDPRNLHIWEHSVTLYHGFDWQAAAENFLFLSRVIEQNQESTLCLLNAAIIFARLGEYGTASQILADAEPVGDTMPLTMFVMGHVEFELGNFEKAEDSFKVALNSLSGRAQSYSHLGLEFQLKASHIQQDLRVFASRNNLYGFLGTLGALPADGIFNSPSSMPVSKPTWEERNARNSVESGYVPTLTNISTPTSPTVSPVEGYFQDEKNSGWWQGANQETDIPVTIRDDSISEALEDVRAGFEDLKSPPKPAPPPMVSLPATPEPSIKSRRRFGGIIRSLSIRPNSTAVTQTVDQSKHPALQARDARGHGGDTGDLANFILNLPAQGQRKPRDAEVSKESTRDLAAFLRNPGDVPMAHPAASLAGDDGSLYSTGGNEAAGAFDSVTDRDLHRLAAEKPAPAPPTPRRRFRDNVASLIINPRENAMRTAPPSIRRSDSTSSAGGPDLTALPSVSTRSSSLRIHPSNPVPRKLAKGKPQKTTEKKPNPNAPKMVSAEQPMNFTDFFPKFMAKRMSEW